MTASQPGRWAVRRATDDDGPPIVSVAAAAWRDTYPGLLRPETIETFVERAYSPERVAARIRDDELYVAEGPMGIVAFADAVAHDDRLELQAIYALPAARGRGAGSALLDALVRRFPALPISADVLEGNRIGEAFYERRGFVPRERLEVTLLDEAVVERRWWRPPASSDQDRRAALRRSRSPSPPRRRRRGTASPAPYRRRGGGARRGAS